MHLILSLIESSNRLLIVTYCNRGLESDGRADDDGFEQRLAALKKAKGQTPYGESRTAQTPKQKAPGKDSLLARPSLSLIPNNVPENFNHCGTCWRLARCFAHSSRYKPPVGLLPCFQLHCCSSMPLQLSCMYVATAEALNGGFSWNLCQYCGWGESISCVKTHPTSV